MKSVYLKAGLALLIANVIWGAGPPIFKWSFENVHPFTLAFLRYLIPTIFLFIFFFKYIRIMWKDVWLLGVIGIFSVTLNIGFYFIGIEHTASINAPIISCVGPAFVIMGSILFLRERPTKQMLLGNLVGLTGVLLIVAEPILLNTNHTTLFGNLLLLSSDIAAAIGTLIAKDVTKRYHPITMTFWLFFVGTLTFLPLFGQDVVQYGFLTNVNQQGLIGILWGGIFSSLIAWLLFFYGLEHENASETSIFNYIQPVAALLIAAPLLHEYPHTFFYLGSILVFLGMFIAENHRKKHAQHVLRK